MTDKQLGVLVHGAGWVSEHIRAYQNNPHARVVAISRRMKVPEPGRGSGLKDVGLYTDYEKPRT